jgi:hypothetical protein
MWFSVDRAALDEASLEDAVFRLWTPTTTLTPFMSFRKRLAIPQADRGRRILPAHPTF